MLANVLYVERCQGLNWHVEFQRRLVGPSLDRTSRLRLTIVLSGTPMTFESIWRNFNLSCNIDVPVDSLDTVQVAIADTSGQLPLVRETKNVTEVNPPISPDVTISTAEDPDSAPETLARDTGDAHSVIDETDSSQPRPRPDPKPAKLSIMERFARAQGFRKDGDERFFHENGSWICRAHNVRSLWEHYAVGGGLVRSYWPKDHCVESDPLPLDADVWNLIDQSPDTHALILANIEGSPVEPSWTRLRAMRDAGELTLFPASYRLVYVHDRHS